MTLRYCDIADRQSADRWAGVAGMKAAIERIEQTVLWQFGGYGNDKSVRSHLLRWSVSDEQSSTNSTENRCR